MLPGRYVDDDETREPGQVRNQVQLIDYTQRLADRIDHVWTTGSTPLVLGGDCSVLLAAGVATARRGRTGLVHIDGHTDFRHPGNDARSASLAGEDLAAVVGWHWPAIANIDGLSPYFNPRRAAHLGHIADDEHIEEAQDVLGCVLPGTAISGHGIAGVCQAIVGVAGPSYWLQVDVDILDPSVMPAVDSPDPGGIDASELTHLLAGLGRPPSERR